MHNEGGGVSSRSASHNFSLRLHDITNQRSALVIVDKEPFTITIRAAIEATNSRALLTLVHTWLEVPDTSQNPALPPFSYALASWAHRANTALLPNLSHSTP